MRIRRVERLAAALVIEYDHDHDRFNLNS